MTRKCTGQPGMGRGKHAWSFHARSRACSVRGPGRPRTTRRGLLSFAQLSSCRPESIGRRERKPCGSRSGRKPSGTQAVSSRAVRGLHASRAERGSGGWSRARGLVVTGRTNRPDCRRATPRPMTWRRPDSAEREQDLVRLTSPGMHEERRQDAGTQAVRWESARSCWRVCCSRSSWRACWRACRLECLTITDSRASWRVCLLVECLASARVDEYIGACMLACVLLVDGLTITDSCASWRVCCSWNA